MRERRTFRTLSGDTIDVRAGVYNEKLVVRNGGSGAGGFMTLRAHPGEAVVLDGAGHEVALDGALAEGSRLQVKRAARRGGRA